MPNKTIVDQEEHTGHRVLLVQALLSIFLIFPLLTLHFLFSIPQKANRPARASEINPRNEPVQSALLTADPITLEKAGYVWRMIPRADYQISARVLHSKRYEDWQANFAPVDLALGWGKMSNPTVDMWIEWRQADRWYFYRWPRHMPLLQDEIRNFSANVHIIPATESLAAVINQLERNDIVLMEGKLVDVEADNLGEVYHFQTSLTRFDTADNSCEIFYVERLVVGTEEFH